MSHFERSKNEVGDFATGLFFGLFTGGAKLFLALVFFWLFFGVVVPFVCTTFLGIVTVAHWLKVLTVFAVKASAGAFALFCVVKAFAWLFGSKASSTKPTRRR